MLVMRLLDYMHREELTQTELATRLGFSVSTIHGWLNEREPSPAAVLAIVKATGGAVRPADLRRDLADAERIAQPREIA